MGGMKVAFVMEQPPHVCSPLRKKAEGCDSSHHGIYGKLPFVQQTQLILSKMFLSHLVGPFAKVAGEVLDGATQSRALSGE